MFEGYGGYEGLELLIQHEGAATREAYSVGWGLGSRSDPNPQLTEWVTCVFVAHEPGLELRVRVRFRVRVMVRCSKDKEDKKG